MRSTDRTHRQLAHTRLITAGTAVQPPCPPHNRFHPPHPARHHTKTHNSLRRHVAAGAANLTVDPQHRRPLQLQGGLLVCVEIHCRVSFDLHEKQLKSAAPATSVGPSASPRSQSRSSPQPASHAAPSVRGVPAGSGGLGLGALGGAAGLHLRHSGGTKGAQRVTRSALGSPVAYSRQVCAVARMRRKRVYPYRWAGSLAPQALLRQPTPPTHVIVLQRIKTPFHNVSTRLCTYTFTVLQYHLFKGPPSRPVHPPWVHATCFALSVL